MGEAGGVRHRQRLFSLSSDQKRVTRSAHRLRPPEEMLASVAPLLAVAGVTRLANITGLDRIGIPVVVGMRPNGRTLSQAAGKGVTIELAMLSAAMESIELFHAEVAELPSVRGPYVELAKQYAMVPLEYLPLTRHSLFSPFVPERWTFGRDLLAEARAARLEAAEDTNEESGAPITSPATGAPMESRGSGAPIASHGSAAPMEANVVAVPMDMVLLPRRPERVRNSSLFSFQTTSNGLASGSAFVEALTMALLEVIERDAVACWRVAAACGGRPTPRVRLQSARHFPLAREVLEQIERAGVKALVYDCTVDTAVPVYRAILYEATERQVGLAEGWGAHLDTELALVRALTEAAQSRAVAIAGARDDRFGRDIARARLTDSRSRIVELEAQPATVDLRAHESHAAPAFSEDVETLLAHLIRVGIQQVIVADLTLPAFRDVLSVVRVIVPMLAGPGFEQGHPSPRANAFAARNGVAH